MEVFPMKMFQKWKYRYSRFFNKNWRKLKFEICIKYKLELLKILIGVLINKRLLTISNNYPFITESRVHKPQTPFNKPYKGSNSVSQA